MIISFKLILLIAILLSMVVGFAIGKLTNKD
jgi:hypothetical protein